MCHAWWNKENNFHPGIWWWCCWIMPLNHNKMWLLPIERSRESSMPGISLWWEENFISLNTCLSWDIKASALAARLQMCRPPQWQLAQCPERIGTSARSMACWPYCNYLSWNASLRFLRANVSPSLSWRTYMSNKCSLPKGWDRQPSVWMLFPAFII